VREREYMCVCVCVCVCVDCLVMLNLTCAEQSEVEEQV